MQEQKKAEEARPVVIEVDDLKMSFGDRTVLDGVSFQVEEGRICVILGQSRSGKSTIVRCLVGADKPEQGRVRLFGQDITKASGEELDGLRRRFGCVFQAGGLYSSMTVEENVAFAIREHTEMDDEVIVIMAQIKLAQVGMQEEARKMPGELSGEMQKRAAIARALALDPEILFYDDPTAGLDPVAASRVGKLIVELSRALGVTSLVVTHDVKNAFRMADNMIMLHEGKVIVKGSPATVRSCPVPEVRQFVRGEMEGNHSAEGGGAAQDGGGPTSEGKESIDG